VVSESGTVKRCPENILNHPELLISNSYSIQKWHRNLTLDFLQDSQIRAGNKPVARMMNLFFMFIVYSQVMVIGPVRLHF